MIMIMRLLVVIQILAIQFIIIINIIHVYLYAKSPVKTKMVITQVIFVDSN